MNNNTITMPGFLQWKIGRAKVTVINDSFFEAGEALLTHLPGEGVRNMLEHKFRPQRPTLTINIFLVEQDGHAPVLIDAGMGDKMAPHLQGRLLEALDMIGVHADRIGTILLTHLHGDHFYGLVDREGNRNFPNAKVWLSNNEYQYWLENTDIHAQDAKNAEDARHALARYERLTVQGEEILPGITSVPLPGHTKGQTGFMLESEGEKLLFCADILTVPAIQAELPGVGFATDFDHDMAVQTRVATLERATQERLLIAGAHFEFPCISYVTRHGKGFQLIPKQWF